MGSRRYEHTNVALRSSHSSEYLLLSTVRFETLLLDRSQSRSEQGSTEMPPGKYIRAAQSEHVF
jgi:hypothetical protein